MDSATDEKMKKNDIKTFVEKKKLWGQVLRAILAFASNVGFSVFISKQHFHLELIYLFYINVFILKRYIYFEIANIF